MNLDLFFTPLDESVYEPLMNTNSWLDAITVNKDNQVNWKDADIVMFGVEESRGSKKNEGASYGSLEVRKRLYQLRKGSGTYHIVDLGNLNPGIKRLDTCLRIKEVCSLFLQEGVIPLIIGGTHDLDYGQFMAYENLDDTINMVNIDATFDIDDNENSLGESKHIMEILLHKPNYLAHYAHIAYQAYLVDPEVLRVFEKLSFEKYRVGEIRDSLQDMEPVMRYADMVSFDISAIKRNDAPGNANAQAFGLTGEEACQLAWYAGLSDKLSSFGLYGFNPKLDEHEQTASVLAIMLWYFIEGYYNKTDDLNFDSDNYIKFIVHYSELPHKICFYKSKLSGKWWLEVSEGNIIPCSIKDYEAAKQGEIPDRYLLFNS